MDQYRLSIIIPHYNIPDLLEKLLESIPNRNDVQIIVVDDHSDENIDLLNSVIHKYRDRNLEWYSGSNEKHSTGLCRNVGLDHATGKWILFADADDYFVDGWFERLQPYFDSDYDLVQFVPTSLNLDTGEQDTRHQMYVDKVLPYIKQPTHDNELIAKYDIASVCLKLHRRSFLVKNQLRFIDNFAEDIVFSAQCAVQCEKFTCTDAVVYCITRRGGSKTSQIDREKYDDRVKAKILRLALLYQHLSEEDILVLNLETAGIQTLYSAFADKMGVRKVMQYRTLMKEKNVPIFNWKYMNPLILAGKFLRSLSGRLR